MSALDLHFGRLEMDLIGGQRNPLFGQIQKLAVSHAELLTLARLYASECGECGGTGLRTIYNYDDHGSDADDQPCLYCADIRAAIAKAEGVVK